MKKTIFIIIISLLVFFNSCSELDLSPISSITTASMWKTNEDAIAAKNGMYFRFRAAFFQAAYRDYTELRTGLYKFGKSYYATNYPHLANELQPSTRGSDWGPFYTLINQCNLILKYVPGITFTDTDAKNQILAEAYTMRALTYFWLVRIWGEVPVLQNPFESDAQADLFPVRDPVSKAYDLIKEDIAKAESLYPASRKQAAFLINPAAIQMIKTDVYLWLYKVQNQSDALAKAEEGINAVLANTSYGLESNFKDIFKNESNSKENIFTIYLEIDESGNSWYGNVIWRDGDIPKQYHNNPVPVGGDNNFMFTELIWNPLYENSNDQRSKATIDSMHYGTNIWEWCVKFAGTYTDRRRIDIDQPLYRYAEALLFQDEIENAKNATASAVGYLNQVAKRAYGADNFYSTALSKTAVDELILKERAKEFMFEGRYWWDLIRFGKAFEKVPSLAGRQNVQNVLLWPVSVATISNNPNITQTPGY